MRNVSVTKTIHNEPNLSDLLDFSPTIIYRAVPSGDFKITYVSNNICDILGYKPEDIYVDDDFWHNHIHPVDRPNVFQNLPNLFVDGRHITDYRFENKLGKYVWIHDQMHLVKDVSGNVIDVVGSVTDITERKLTEIALAEQENRLDAIFQTAQSGIITIESNGIINSVNPAVSTIFGYKMDELIGNNVSMLMSDVVADKHDDYLQLYQTNQQPQWLGLGPREVVGCHKNGGEFPIEMSIDYIKFGDRDQFVAILNDITERKKSEAEIYRYSTEMELLVKQRTAELVVARDKAESAEMAMSSFLSNMSHELRTPLHGILSFANFGIKKYRKVSPEKLEQYFLEIHDSGEHLLYLINDLLDLSKMRAGKMVYDFQIASFDELIHEILHEMRLLAREKKIRVDYCGQMHSNKISMDSTKISQVIRNLLSNAIKFSPVDSIITITVTAATGDCLCMKIIDQGVGVPVGEQQTIFNAFVQSSETRTNAGGTGLGLPICKEIVETGHHGSIDMHSGKNGGSVFTVILPISNTK